MSSLFGVVCLALVAATCAPEPEPNAALEDEEPMATVRAAEPDTTAAAMWSFLQDADYAQAWDTWPGLDAYYEGGDPHGMLLTTWANEPALGAVGSASASVMPAGAVIVKENYMPDSTLAAVTVMYKRPGYDPEHSDWFFAKYQPDGAVDAAGRVPGCQGCHERGPDYVRSPGFGETQDTP